MCSLPRVGWEWIRVSSAVGKRAPSVGTTLGKRKKSLFSLLDISRRHAKPASSKFLDDTLDVNTLCASCEGACATTYRDTRRVSVRLSSLLVCSKCSRIYLHIDFFFLFFCLSIITCYKSTLTSRQESRVDQCRSELSNK